MDITLFDAIRKPYRGLRTFPDSTAIPPGYWKDARNIRVDTGAIKLRGGQVLEVAGPTNADTCYGSFFFEQGLYVYHYVAVHISTDGATVVRIYLNQYTIAAGTWGGWGEVTAGSGAYGNTRMTATSDLFTFISVDSRNSEPTIIVQNETDDPRLLLGNQSAKIVSIDAPTEHEAYKPQFGFSATYQVQAAATATNSNGARFAVSASNSGYLYTFTTPTANDTALMALNSGTVDFTGGKQAIMIIDIRSAGEQAINGCKWELRSGGTYYTIHDVANGVDNLVSAETEVPGFRMYGFALDEHENSLTAVDAIRLTVVDANIIAGSTLRIGAIQAGGHVPGFSQYGITYGNTATQTESPSVLLVNPTQAESRVESFVPATKPGTWFNLGYFHYPLSPVFYYQVTLPTLRPSTTLRDAGVNTIYVYRADPGETEFLYANEYTVAAYSGSWAYSGSYNSSAKVFQTENAPSWTRDDSREMPSSFNEPVPKGSCGIYAGSRCYIGTNKKSGKPFNVVKVSDKGEAFRFRSVPGDDDPNSGFLAELEGQEIVKGFSSSSSSLLGNQNVYCFSTGSTYSISGQQILRISSIGCRATHSIAEHKGRMFWFDSDLSIRRSAGQVDDVSRLRIDDILTAATNTNKMSGEIWRDRYYLAYSGGVLVWSDLLGDWESRDTPGVTPVKFNTWRVNGQSYLKFTSANGSLYRYDSGTDDAGTQINFLMQTPDLHGKNFEKMIAGVPSVVCSDKDAESLTVTLTASKPAIAQVGTMSLDAGTGQTVTWREPKRSTGGKMGVQGASINVKFEATLTSPFTIQGIALHDVEGDTGYGRDS